jgi:Secretion system C-terminal sorting domain
MKVVGDFTINDNFYISNAVIKVSAGKKILLSSPSYWSAMFLQLNNTKIFACGSLWKGIEMSFLTAVEMTNCRVEDAEVAINATDAAFASIHSDGNIFDRNKIGIKLETINNGWYVLTPRIGYLYNTKFWSTSALNDGSARGDVGIKIKNVPYPLAYNYGNTYNFFKGLENGIVMSGPGTTYDVYGYFFDKIKDKCIEFTNGEQLNVSGTSFRDIEYYGIDFLESKVLNCQSNTFELYNRDDAADPLKGRFMVRIKDPIAGNNLTVINNNLGFVGRQRNLSRGIEITTAGFPVDPILTALIAGNYLEQYNHHPSPGNQRGYSLGINLEGNFIPGSSVKLENNTFDFNAYPVGITGATTGINADFGNKNGLKIIDNTFISGSAYFCRLGGSTGSNNEISGNVANRGDGNFLGGSFLSLENFENTKICNNTDNFASSVSFFFLRQCQNLDFRNNTTVGRDFRNLWITNSGVIGTQFNKGNKWISGPNLLGATVNPELRHNNPELAKFSLFTVHTPQSTNSNNSPFFPVDVFPNNNTFFEGKVINAPNSSCLGQLAGLQTNPEVDPQLDPAIANGTYARLMNNNAITFDGEMYLQKKIKKNNKLINDHIDIKSFAQKHEFSNIGKLAKLKQDVEEGQSIDAVKLSKIQALQKKIENLEEKMKKYNKNVRPTHEVMKQQIAERLELSMAIQDIYNEDKKEKKLKFKKIKSDADNVIPTSLPEKYFKEVYQIYTDALSNDNVQFTSEQRLILKKIASTCVTEGGKIVYMARGFLSPTERQEALKSVETCEARPKEELIETPPYLQKNDEYLKTAVILYPNPSKGILNINIPSDLTAKVDIFNVTGSLTKTFNLGSGHNTLKTELSEGMYIAKINLSNGEAKAIKFSITH